MRAPYARRPSGADRARVIRAETEPFADVPPPRRLPLATDPTTPDQDKGKGSAGPSAASGRRWRDGPLLLRLAIPVALGWFTVHRVPIPEIVGHLQRADPRWFAGGLAVLFLMRGVGAVRLHVLCSLRDIAISLPDLLRIGFISVFYGLAVPGALAGGAVRWQRMRKLDPQPLLIAVAIGFNRLVDTLVVVALGAAFWVAQAAGGQQAGSGAAVFAALVALLAVYFVASSRGATAAVGSIAARVGHVPETVQGRVARLARALAGYAGLTWGDHARILGLSALRYGLGVVALGSFATALDVELSWLTIAWVLSVIKVIELMPFAFSGLGVREASLVVLLGPLGVAGSEAVALSLAAFAGNLCLAAVGGALEVGRVARRRP